MADEFDFKAAEEIQVCAYTICATKPPASRTIKKTSSLEINGRAVDEKQVSRPTIRVTPSEWTGRFATCRNDLMNRLRPYRATIRRQIINGEQETPTQIKVRINAIKSLRMMLFMRSSVPTIREIAEDHVENCFNPLKQELIDNWDDIIANQRAAFYDQELWDANANALPTKAELSEYLRMDLVDLQMITLDQTGAEYFAALIKSIREGMSDQVAAAAAELRQRLLSGERFTAKTFTEINEVVGQLSTWAKLADPDLLEAVAEFRAKLDEEGGIQQVVKTLHHEIEGVEGDDRLNKPVVFDLTQSLDKIMKVSPDFATYAGAEIMFD